jgi:hypothetical protein
METPLAQWRGNARHRPGQWAIALRKATALAYTEDAIAD